ncbi:hypothetical protein OG689_00630 [Kitasatospora sp. NBC_00240]|uniref:hypothetical protein n=1 Tax=Kitasatospora sp. NBC_00240 TaxID=2903567 RepID=UPI00225038BB|nr:hypothetical protein [Kitasatospora sp. NBC_00240]MCX5207838.1 hypothetical protein [Kitasatospora sp. NBC_00240]
MFELSPGTGLALPQDAGVLRFGMSERECQWAVATLADVRETWICQAGWAFSACYEGVELVLWGDSMDRLGRADHDRHGFAAVELRRCEPRPTRPSAVAVVLDDIDLFGYPAAEVTAVVGPNPHPGLRLPPVRPPSRYLPVVWLSAV